MWTSVSPWQRGSIARHVRAGGATVLVTPIVDPRILSVGDTSSDYVDGARDVGLISSGGRVFSSAS